MDETILAIGLAVQIALLGIWALAAYRLRRLRKQLELLKERKDIRKPANQKGTD